MKPPSVSEIKSLVSGWKTVRPSTGMVVQVVRMNESANSPIEKTTIPQVRNAERITRTLKYQVNEVNDMTLRKRPTYEELETIIYNLCHALDMTKRQTAIIESIVVEEH